MTRAVREQGKRKRDEGRVMEGKRERWGARGGRKRARGGVSEEGMSCKRRGGKSKGENGREWEEARTLGSVEQSRRMGRD